MGDRQYFMDIISGLAERTIKRLWIVVILLIVLLVATNAMWICYEQQYEVATVTQEVLQEVETRDGSTIVNGIGDVTNGESKAESQNNCQAES